MPELALVSAGRLVIGDRSVTGNVQISAPLVNPGGADARVCAGNPGSNRRRLCLRTSRTSRRAAWRLIAGAGIGAAGNPLEIAVGRLEAETAGRQHFRANAGELAIGGVDSSLRASAC